MGTWGRGSMGVKGRARLVRWDRLIRRDLEEGKAGQEAVAMASRRPIR